MQEDSPESKLQSNPNHSSDFVAADPKPELPESFDNLTDGDGVNSSVGSLIFIFISSLIAIGIVGLIYGATFNWRLVSVRGEYFGEMQDIINVVLFLPLATILFGGIAVASRNIVYWVYPWLAFFLAGIIRPTPVSDLLAGYVPLLPPANTPYYLTSLVAVTLAYILVHAFVWPLRHLIRSRKMRTRSEKRIFAVSAALLLILLSVCGIVAKYSHSLLTSQQRSRATVHIPASTSPVLNSPTEYTLYQKEGASYMEVGDVVARPVAKWWSKSPHEVCGSKTTTTVRPGQSPSNLYATTPDGISYSTAIFNANASQPAVATAAFKEYRYCFVLGYQHYILIRNDRGPNAEYLQKYPTAQLIDTIAKAPAYLTACGNKKPSYCKPTDTVELNKLNAQVRTGIGLQASSTTPGVTTPTINKNAYKQTGKLSIPEWGISFPLSADIQDAYYTPKKDNQFIIKLHSLDSNTCFDTDGVAYLTRRAISDIQPSPNTTIQGKVVNNYVYSLYGNAGLQFCANRGNVDNARADKLQDVFEWAEASIQ